MPAYSNTKEKIIATLFHEPMDRFQLAETLKVSTWTAHHYLSELEREGQVKVVKKRDNGRFVYTATENIRSNKARITVDRGPIYEITSSTGEPEELDIKTVVSNLEDQKIEEAIIGCMMTLTLKAIHHQELPESVTYDDIREFALKVRTYLSRLLQLTDQFLINDISWMPADNERFFKNIPITNKGLVAVNSTVRSILDGK